MSCYRVVMFYNAVQKSPGKVHPVCLILTHMLHFLETMAF